MIQFEFGGGGGRVMGEPAKKFQGGRGAIK